jgi:hypothetical protein
MFGGARVSPQAVGLPLNAITSSTPCELLDDIRAAATAEAVATAAVATKTAALVEFEAASVAAIASLEAARGRLLAANRVMMRRHVALLRTVERCREDPCLTTKDKEDLAQWRAALGLLDNSAVARTGTARGNLTDVDCGFIVSGKGGSSKTTAIPAAKAKAAAGLKAFSATKASMIPTVLKKSHGAIECVSFDARKETRPLPKEKAPLVANVQPEVTAAALQAQLVAERRARLAMLHALFQARDIDRAKEEESASSNEEDTPPPTESFRDPPMAPRILARKRFRPERTV